VALITEEVLRLCR